MYHIACYLNISITTMMLLKCNLHNVSFTSFHSPTHNQTGLSVYPKYMTYWRSSSQRVNFVTISHTVSVRLT